MAALLSESESLVQSGEKEQHGEELSFEGCYSLLYLSVLALTTMACLHPVEVPRQTVAWSQQNHFT